MFSRLSQSNMVSDPRRRLSSPLRTLKTWARTQNFTRELSSKQLTPRELPQPYQTSLSSSLGSAPEPKYIGSGETVRCVAEGAISSDSFDGMRALVRQRGEPEQFRTDDRNYITVHPSGANRSFPHFSSEADEEIETTWGAHPDRIGRWSIQVRPDGSREGALQFYPIERGACSELDWQKLFSSTKRFCEDTMKGPGRSLAPLFARRNWRGHCDRLHQPLD